jgi:DNA polymerase-3 subunit epsilon
MSEENPVYCIVDVETTGGRGRHHKLTEIAMIKFNGHDIIDSYETLVNPERSIPYKITYLTGITNEMVSEAPKFYEVAREILEFLEGCIFVAHNVFFDFNVIRGEFSELGYQWKAPKMCTVRLSRKFLPGHASYSLGKICQDLGIKITNRHRAYGDAKATVELFKMVLNVCSAPDLVQQTQKQAQLTLPSGMERVDLESLPSRPGIYYLKGENNEILYIGKSKNIKQRVKNHFRPDLKRKKDMELKEKVSSVDFNETGHEWVALLLEAHEIKEYRPLFNKSLNRVRFRYSLILKEDHEGRYEIGITSYFDSSANPACLYKGRKVSEKARDSLYRQAFGVVPGQIAWTSLVRTLGLDDFNRRVKKVFNEKDYPQADMTISLPTGTLKQEIVIQIQAGELGEVLWVKSGEVVQRLNIKEDPDIKRLMLSLLRRSC